MTDSNNPKHGIHRRDLLKGAAAAGIGLASGAIGIPNAFGQNRRNLIQTDRKFDFS